MPCRVSAGMKGSIQASLGGEGRVRRSGGQAVGRSVVLVRFIGPGGFDQWRGGGGGRRSG